MAHLGLSSRHNLTARRKRNEIYPPKRDFTELAKRLAAVYEARLIVKENRSWPLISPLAEIIRWSLFFAVVWFCSSGVSASEGELTVAEQRQLEAEEDSWPHWLNIYTLAGSGGFSAIEFFKFSSNETENYSGGRPVLCKWNGLEQLPTQGWLRNAQTGQSVGYAIHVVENDQFVALTGASSSVVQNIRAQLMANGSAVFFAELPNTGERALPGTLKDFMNHIGTKWAAGGLEFIESTFQPPVWRTVPLKTEIKRMSVQEWNQKVAEAEAHESK
jgi:hypothetical protein